MADPKVTLATETYGDVTGFTNYALSTEIADTRNSALNAQIYTTVDTSLQGETGDIVKVGRITPTGEAEDVAEGSGNTKKISVGVDSFEYEIKTAQDWFQYTDERLRRTPNEVAAGISQLGVALTNKMNVEVFAELNKATQTQTATALNFDAIVDAQNEIDLDTFTRIGQEEGALAASEQATATQTMLLVGKAQRAAIRKACKDELQYVEAYVRTGYVGTVAGTNIYYNKLMDGTDYAKKAFLFTRSAVTTFIKSGVEVEQSTKNNRSADDANKRINNVFARQSYIVALTDATKIVAITIGA